MAFSDAFARGYAVGDAMKKRRATSKFFEKFKELTDEPAEDTATAIPGMGADQPAAPAETALPVQDAGADGMAPIVGEEAAAIPVKVQGPKEIPLGDSAEKFATTLTRDNIKELDRLALDAAKASGDMEVYKALKDTTVSFLQSKTLSNLSQAQSAMQEGDTDAAEKYLKKAYRYVPDGKEAKFKKKDGSLWVSNPWAGQEGEPDEIELTAGRIGQLGVMLSDPRKYSELLMQEEKDREAAKERAADRKLREREVAVREGGLGVDKDNVSLRAREVSIKEKNAPLERLAMWADIDYKKAMAAAQKDKTKDPKIMEGANAIASETFDQFKSMTTPPNDMYGQPDPNWQPPDTIMKTDKNGQPVRMTDGELLTASSLAQSIAVANLGKVSPGESIAAGLAMVKGRDPYSDFNVQVDATNGTITFPYNGGMSTVALPASTLQGLVQEQKDLEFQQGPTSGQQNPRR